MARFSGQSRPQSLFGICNEQRTMAEKKGERGNHSLQSSASCVYKRTFSLMLHEKNESSVLKIAKESKSEWERSSKRNLSPLIPSSRTKKTHECSFK